jgi:glycosyltransferase involved in cell wall biosynthesis
MNALGRQMIPIELKREISGEFEDLPIMLSLVVATLGRAQELARLFDSLARQTDTRFEVLLIDQNSDDRLSPLVAKFESSFRIMRLRSLPGLSRSRNVGIAAARGSIVGFPDDDCWYSDDTVHGVSEFFRANESVDAVCGRTVDAKGKESLGHFQKFSSDITRLNVWSTHNSNTVFMRARKLKLLGGFDETLGLGANGFFQSGEETDLLLRFLARGGRVQFRQDLKIFHDQVKGSAAEMLNRARKYSPGFGRVLRKHNFGLLYFGYRVLRTCASAILAALKGDMAEARYKTAWARGTIKGYVASPKSGTDCSSAKP